MKNLLTETTGANNSFDRRQFITTLTKTACVAAFANIPFALNATPGWKDDYTIQQVIDIPILAILSKKVPQS